MPYINTSIVLAYKCNIKNYFRNILLFLNSFRYKWYKKVQLGRRGQSRPPIASAVSLKKENLIYILYIFFISDNTSKHMRYANSLESLDSVSSSIQQARAYSRHTVSKNSQISVIYDEGIQQFLPKKLKLTLFFLMIIVPKSQHFV